MPGYDKIFSAIPLELSRFSASIPEEQLKDFHDLLRLSKLGPETYENRQKDGKLGLSYEWMSQAKSHWETAFDWRASEKHINSFPNFTAQIKDENENDLTIHFVALFSEKQDAIPVILMHGWPGSFLEFLGMLCVFKAKYSPEELPFHLIVPSLPGCGFSSGPPLDKNWQLEDIARVMHKLMVGLGFGSGYAVQGGDVGSYVARIMATTNEACKALHLNFCNMRQPETVTAESLSQSEREAVGKFEEFSKTGAAYALEHGTRPATIGFVLSSSPLALLAWIGEKFLEWTDETPSLDHILESVTLYWFTQSFPRWIYPYRQAFSRGPERYMLHSDPKYYCQKPFGYSGFPKELAPLPKSWIATTGDLIWFRQHSKGGHFAAMERPETMVADIEDFLHQVWPAK